MVNRSSASPSEAHGMSDSSIVTESTFKKSAEISHDLPLSDCTEAQ